MGGNTGCMYMKENDTDSYAEIDDNVRSTKRIIIQINPHKKSCVNKDEILSIGKQNVDLHYNNLPERRYKRLLNPNKVHTKSTQKKTIRIKLYNINEHNIKELTFCKDKCLPSRNQKLMRSIESKEGHVYLEGKLMKYHPGFRSHYISKYCKATKEYFSYCEPQCKMDKNNIFARIDYTDIKIIRRTNIKFDKTNIVYKQFEIIMKKDWLLKYSSTRKLSQSMCSLFRRNTYNNSPSNKVSGHLLLKPRKSVVNISFENTLISKPRLPCVFVNHIAFESADEACSYEQYVEEKGLKLKQLGIKEVIYPKFYMNRCTSGIKGKQTWSNRELEWYEAKGRLIFFAESLQECERWIYLLNWLITIK